MSEKLVQQLAEDLGGEIKDMGRLPDGSGFAIMSLPLPKDHWIYEEGEYGNIPPMPFRMGTNNPQREWWCAALIQAGRYAVKCATMNGKEMDFDPDALVQNLVVGFLGYQTEDGLTSDLEFNPNPIPPEQK